VDADWPSIRIAIRCQLRDDVLVHVVHLVHLRTTPGSSLPIYRQIVDQIRAAILRGELAPGESLPSVRAVAEDLVVNANTVAKAYGELVRANDVVSEPGRGVFVAHQRPHVGSVERRRRLRAAIERLLAEAINVGATRAELEEALDDCCVRARVLVKGGRHGSGRESA
jgi:GntR family transcriptional regulator